MPGTFFGERDGDLGLGITIEAAVSDDHASGTDKRLPEGDRNRVLRVLFGVLLDLGLPPRKVKGILRDRVDE